MLGHVVGKGRERRKCSIGPTILNGFNLIILLCFTANSSLLPRFSKKELHLCVVSLAVVLLCFYFLSISSCLLTFCKNPAKCLFRWYPSVLSNIMVSFFFKLFIRIIFLELVEEIHMFIGQNWKAHFLFSTLTFLPRSNHY